jgi:cephalosporin-C deacetylase-like acetyl esterase
MQADHNYSLGLKLTWSLSIFLLFFSTLVQAQPARKVVEVVVAPEHADWTYKPGERADFKVQILRNGLPVSGIKATYEIGPEQMPAVKTGELELKDGTAKIQGIALDKAGFLRCTVSAEWEGKTYQAWGTAGYAPGQIEPVVEMPEDFDEFWTKAKEQLATLPIDAKMTLVPEYCTGEIDVYHVSLQNIATSWRGASRFYGMLSVPKAPGKYPAILVVPGAGVRAYNRDDRAAEGVIVLKVGIHGVPVNMDPEVYNDLGRGALSNYQINKLDDLDQYYYKRVYMGCVRAIDFIYSLPQFDGENLAVTGGSQGGALSIITAGLDDRVKYLAAFYPALCDVTGYLEGRAGGWPHMFKDFDKAKQPNWLKVAPYYDVVNFAKKLSMPGWYSWGYNDNVCPPTSMYAAYNSISAKKELHTFQETAHWTFPEQQEMANAWLYEKLGVKQ